MSFYEWKPYVSAAKRRKKAEREMQKLKKKGHPVSPVVIDGRAIARTFWGKAWCENLEHYSDFSNRLPRGRTYVRNGSVLDLQVSPGVVKGLVSGSEIYKVTLTVGAVSKPRWLSICADCSGAIDSLVELLQGRFSKGVMARICHDKTGLFPAPSEIKFSCSCPDWASMCKHVAAVLYGIGARLDVQPDLLFRLREVDPKELIAQAGRGLPLSKQVPADDRVLAANLSELFGLEFSATEPEPLPSTPKVVEKAAPQRRKTKTSVDKKLASGVKPSKKRTASAPGNSATSKTHSKKATKKKRNNASIDAHG